MTNTTKETGPVIRFTDVHKSFGEKVVLAGFSMELSRGRTLAIMGPSGVGKSVTLKHAIGILTASTGSRSARTSRYRCARTQTSRRTRSARASRSASSSSTSPTPGT